ncbi:MULTISPECIES: ABC transporter permease [Kurthia]|uniref:ABC transporter permease n=1 Tax=Kurthia TaxID=1649 RepID=UPI000745DEAB|nr:MULTISPECIES: ABC transporter permease [Kurthia]AMA63743.1 ABC-2 transporter family protein [Kurthia sp. 11kri321]MEB6112767.1 ABC transporter permease [Kurthia gibsonii]MEB7771496.1 ABC transporter permease [Kurthia gibsonii]WIL37613.1 ABC transporter permease [Kurthia sp. YJT4]
MNKLGLLIKQLYLQKIKSKSFILLTLLYLAIIAVAVNWSSIKGIFTDDNKYVTIALVDDTKLDLAKQFPSDKEVKFKVVKESKKEVDALVKKEKYDAAVYLTSKDQQLAVELATAKSLDLQVQSKIDALAENAGKVYSVQQLNLSAEQAAKILQTNTVVKQVDLQEKTSNKTAEEKSAGILIAYIMGFLIYLFVTSYLSMITTDIASEKGSRVLEVLMASVKPSTHLFSKLIGVFLTGLTQIAILAVGAYILIQFTAKKSVTDGLQEMLGQLPATYFIYVILFFLLSIILFLLIGALAGSLVSKVEEASQVMMPGVFIMLIGFYVMLSGISNPDSLLIKVFSYIPFTSGMLMTLRLGATDISTVSVWISLAILFATVALLFTISVTFYKRSVLTYSSGGIMQKIKTVLKVTT